MTRPFVHRAALVTATVALLSAVPAMGLAFQITSTFSTSCHESITLAAYLFVFEGQTADVPLPSDPASRRLISSIASELPGSITDPRDQFVAVSLLLGVRFPDTGGHSILNFVQVRDAHSDPAEQYKHALRKPADDGREGDRNVVAGVRERITNRIDAMRLELARPPEEQLRRVPTYLDFYGQFEVEVYAPAFELGLATHTLQDSFAHAIRSDDLRRIRHVFNFAEAIAGGHEDERDGLAHSDAMDLCEPDGPNVELVLAARQATAELFAAARDELSGVDDAAVRGVLDAWVTLEPGCDATNDFCNSRWLDLARTDPSGPYLGCTCTTQPRSGPVCALLVVGLGVARRLRPRRRR